MRKTVLITGASAGIGAACAKIFARENWRVLLLGRNKAELQKVTSELWGDGHRYLAIDLSLQNCENKLTAFLKKNSLTHLDLLINNAGINHIGLLGTIDINNAQAVFAVNVLAVICVTQSVLPYLIAARGQIINVSSIVGTAGIPNRSVYSASKAALEALSQAWRIELAQHGVAVSVIRPAGVTTSFHYRTPTDGKTPRSTISVRTPEKIAREIMSLSQTRRRSRAPGMRNALYQFVARYLPLLFEFALKWRMRKER